MYLFRVDKHSCLVFFPAGILLLAALLKSVHLGDSPVLTGYFIGIRVGTIGLVLGEVFVATWLLTGFTKKPALILALTLFFVFLIASGVRWLDGDSDCGCFGFLRVHPSFTFLIDCFAIGLLGTAFLLPNSDTQIIGHAAWVGGVLYSVLCMSIILSLRTTSIDQSGAVEDSSGLVILKPKEWLGDRLPILDHISGNEQIKTGNWTILLYHWDCKQCRRRISWLEANTTEDRIAFVEIPPFESKNKTSVPSIVWTKLNNQREWFVETPLELKIREGIVVEIKMRDDF